MIRFMKMLWERQIEWLFARVQENLSVLQQPRAMCEHHAAGCYLCPRDHCSGMLNDRDDSDPTKPRPLSSGQCIYTSGANGGIGMRFNMSHHDANDYYKMRALERDYSDIRTREMIMAERDFLAALPDLTDGQEVPPAVKRQARPGNVVW